jgi:hypothetical protein
MLFNSDLSLSLSLLTSAPPPPHETLFWKYLRVFSFLFGASNPGVLFQFQLSEFSSVYPILVPTSTSNRLHGLLLLLCNFDQFRELSPTRHPSRRISGSVT